MSDSQSWIDPDPGEYAVALAVVDQRRAEARDALRTADAFVVVTSCKSTTDADLGFIMCTDGDGGYTLEFYHRAVEALVRGIARSLGLPDSVALTSLFQRLLADLVLKDIPDDDGGEE